jgi:hypothetical protein
MALDGDLSQRKHHLYRHFTSKVACCNAEGRKNKLTHQVGLNSKHGISSQASENSDRHYWRASKFDRLNQSLYSIKKAFECGHFGSKIYGVGYLHGPLKWAKQLMVPWAEFQSMGYRPKHFKRGRESKLLYCYTVIPIYQFYISWQPATSLLSSRITIHKTWRMSIPSKISYNTRKHRARRCRAISEMASVHMILLGVLC